MNRKGISLYECSHAKVKKTRIACEKGHHLGNCATGTIGIVRLIRGDALQFEACQLCEDFDRNGPPVPKNERGWKEYN